MSDNKQVTEIKDLLERDGVTTEVESAEITEIKHYTLRKLNSKDISPMIRILKKVDLKRFKQIIQENDLLNLLSSKVTKNDEENEEIQENDSSNLIGIAGDVLIEVVPILLDAIDNAIPDVNKLLAGVANVEVLEIENLDLDVYFNLIYDFITKPEFAGFIKAVSKLYK